LFSYNIDIKKVKIIATDGYSDAHLSPTFDYLVFPVVDHSGACQDVSNLEILNLDTLQKAGTTTFGQDEFGNTVFVSWVDNTHFQYKQTYESMTACNNGQAPSYPTDESSTRTEV
jgi:hypothetical protein